MTQSVESHFQKEKHSFLPRSSFQKKKKKKFLLVQKQKKELPCSQFCLPLSLSRIQIQENPPTASKLDKKVQEKEKKKRKKKKNKSWGKKVGVVNSRIFMHEKTKKENTTVWFHVPLFRPPVVSINIHFPLLRHGRMGS